MGADAPLDHAVDAPRVVLVCVQPGGCAYVYGSATTVRSLLAADLVDELVLAVVPLVLDSGKKLFADLPAPLAFDLV